jgi:hypothetical protein
MGFPVRLLNGLDSHVAERVPGADPAPPLTERVLTGLDGAPRFPFCSPGYHGNLLLCRSITPVDG